jgi:hypothetical protein
VADFQSTTRFSDRVDDHVRYRPDYPVALLDRPPRGQGAGRHWRMTEVDARTDVSSKLQMGRQRHGPMLQALRQLFDNCAEGGTVSFDYDTRIFAGQPV